VIAAIRVLAASAAVGVRFPHWDVDLDQMLRGAAKAAVILVLAYLARWALKRLARRIATRAMPRDATAHGPRAQRAATLAGLLTHVGNIAIVVVAGLLFLDIFINIGPLLAGAGVLGVAISIGGSGVMKDLITGFFMVFEDQYAVGDRVKIGDVEGTVHELTLRTTVIKADDGALHYLANGSITVVTNRSRGRPAVAGGAADAGGAGAR
jgi:moderate conductance mechanosensitive channel